MRSTGANGQIGETPISKRLQRGLLALLLAGAIAFGKAMFVPEHGEPGGLTEFEISTCEYLTTSRTHMDEAVEQSTDLQDAIGSLDRSKWQHLADFDASAGRNAHQTFLEREAAAFE